MGKGVEKKKKKKGRPSLLDLQKRNLREQQQQQQQQLQLKKKKKKGLKDGNNYNSAPILTPNYNSAAATALRRSSRRNPNPSPEKVSEGEDDESEGNRREKDLKLVLKYQISNSNASDSDENAHKKRKINAIGGGSGSADCEKLPDYCEVIEHPMDFGTVRNKLANGAYATLEQFEKDVFLICSNAMQYNAPDTIYFRQARSIHELAKKNFENLRQDSDDNEPETKVVRRGRPPTKNFKKPLGRPSLERARSDFSSDVTLASGAENTALTNRDLGNGTPHLEKSGFTDSSRRFSGSWNDLYTGCLAENKLERNDEVSLSKGYSMKHGKKQVVLDENRRNTYKQFHQSLRESSVLTTFDADKKQLMTVGLHSEHGYTRSLARFAANLGPVAWKIAARRIERCLPAGVRFGPGWVVENDLAPQRPLLLSSATVGLPSSSQPSLIPENLSSASTHSTIELKGDKLTERPEAEDSSEKPGPSTQSSLDGHFKKPNTSSLLVVNRFSEPAKEKAAIIEGLKSQLNLVNSSMGAINTRPPFQIHQNSVIRPGMNGFNGTYGFNMPSQMGKLIGAAGPAGFSFQSPQMVDRISRTDTNFVQPVTASSLNSDDPKLDCSRSLQNLESQGSAPSLPGNHQPTWQVSPHPKPDLGLTPQQKPDAVPPDLNVRFRSPGSPNSSRVDSTQPDLALQL
ncbi:Bromo domain-containing protein [Citrus sinensis]|uniref:Bromo domain-containing protein n=1 Tax=Citrus sinensis TaxID=2711 RepID=A0ACB8IBJ8_CITSI|nr:Bromo domain-containing protein [Citrus sinensis]